MSELFSHEDQGANDAVTQKQAPTSVTFLEPASPAQPEPKPGRSPKRPDRPDSDPS